MKIILLIINLLELTQFSRLLLRTFLTSLNIDLL
jgi:hypothetical protein